MFGNHKTFLSILRAACPVLCLILLSGPSLALTYYWGQHPGKDRIVFRFNGTIPRFTLERTGPKQITVETETISVPLTPKKGRSNLTGSRFISEVIQKDDRLIIETKTRSFGFVHFSLQTENKLVLDFFKDVYGRDWQDSPALSPRAEAARSAPQEKGRKNGTAEPRLEPKTEASAGKGDPAETGGAGPPPAASPDREPKSSTKPAKPRGLSPDEALQLDPSGKSHVIRAKISFAGPFRTGPALNSTGNTEASRNTRTRERPRRSLEKPHNKGNLNATAPEPSVNSSGRPEQPAAVQGEVKGALVLNGTGRNLNATSRSDPKTLLSEGQEAFDNGRYAQSARSFSLVSKMEQAPQDMREQALHRLAESLYHLYEGDFSSHYAQLTGAFEEAINFNPESSLVPRSVYRLFQINLKLGNLPEAKAYFNILSTEHPAHRFVPTGHLQLGDYHLREAGFEKAIKHFQAIIEQWPDSDESIQAHFGLIRCFSKMEVFDKAWEKVEAVKESWPDYRKRNPEFMNVAGYVAMQTDRLQAAKKYFWRYYNLRPDAPEADFVLTRLGDIYLRQGHEGEATVLYYKSISRFSGQEGALVAKMRLAEEGIYDNPRLRDMPSYSSESSVYSPREVYTEILSMHPNSPLAPLAQVKLAMWHLWKKHPLKTLREIEKFENAYPGSDLLGQARRVGQRALKILVQKASREQDQDKVLSLWKAYPFLQVPLDTVPPETLLRVATAMWKQGRIEGALEMARFLLNESSSQQDYTTALKLVLNIHVSTQSWDDIISLSQKIQKHKLPVSMRAQLDYAEALAYENLEKFEKSIGLWHDLAIHEHLTDQQKAFAFFFLAKASLRRDKLENVYIQAQNALSIMLEHDVQTNRDKILDCLDMLIEVTGRSGRRLEALQWAQKYESLIEPDSEEWPAHRYRLAQMYRKAGDIAKWRDILRSLAQRHPNSHYGQMAASDVAVFRLQKEADTLLSQ